MFRFGYANVNCLMNKMNSISSFVEDESINVFRIGETWLLEIDASSYEHINGYSLIRSDVNGNNRKHGVAVCFQILEV